jgi:RNA polymerase sigma factor (sigma-70 family)
LFRFETLWRISKVGPDMLPDMSDTDLELLARYTRQHAEDAFAELVRRHLGLVYSAALRQVRSPQLAEEVGQSVFTDLARSAAKLKPDTVLTAWLYQITRRTAIDVVRREASRQLREQIATEMNAMNATTADWTHIEPLLDEAMHALDETDRTAVLLRYFENKSLREVGATLGTSENAAQKRLARAVERLREFFAKRGVTVGASGLVVVISANAVQAAPIGLAVTISTTVLVAGTTCSTITTAAIGKAIAMTTLQKTVVAAALLAAGATMPWVIQQSAQVKLREENQSLRQRVKELNQLVAENEQRSRRRSFASRLPTPRIPAAAAPAKRAEDAEATNLVAQLLHRRDRDRLLQLREGEPAPKLTGAQLESYLRENGRNAASLLAAFRATDDPALLQEAMQKYPKDAQVNFAAVFKKNSTPEEHRQWLESLKRAAPKNALANYLSARDYFKSGQVDQAVQELNAAAGKPQFQDYSSDFVQNDEEAWRAAGYSVAEAKTVASMLLLLPHLGQMKQLNYDMVSLANSYRQAGDEAGAQAALQADLNLGERFDASSGKALVSQLVGMAIQGMALNAMDPASQYGDTGQTVKDRLDELTQQRREIKELVAQFDDAQKRMSNQDWISYKDRWRSFGEEAALRWMVSKYGKE